MSYLDIFWLEYLKYIFIFQIGTIEFVSSQNFLKEQQCVNLEQKVPYLVLSVL